MKRDYSDMNAMERRRYVEGDCGSFAVAMFGLFVFFIGFFLGIIWAHA